MTMYSYQDFKDKISIIQVALDLGYVFLRGDGVSKPSFVIRENGQIKDKIVIVNPHDSSRQGYFRHNGEKGDLISFVKENLNKFNQSFTSDKEIIRVNNVLKSYLGVAHDVKVSLEPLGIRKAKPFDINRYETSNINTYYSMNRLTSILKDRNISQQTAKVFLDKICLIRDKESKFNYQNLAFPYTKPGDDKILGYEIRGGSGFKSKAEGTDSTQALWIADFTDDKLHLKNVFLFESGYDALAYYQIHSSKFNLDECIFCSTGGTFSKQQVENILNYYTPNKLVLGFDNDIAGKIYDIRVACLLNDKEIKIKNKEGNILFDLNGKNFAIKETELNISKFKEQAVSIKNQNMYIHKPRKNFKDWNEVLQKSNQEQTHTVTNNLQRKM